MSQLASQLLPESPLRQTQQSGDELVINLSASTTPMSLVKPAFKELERFTFFVSRRREEGRERFRLHMGYFSTRTEAEHWLQVVRSVYPGAWISDAPGKKLRAQTNPTPVVVPETRVSAKAVPVLPAAKKSNVREVIAALDSASVRAAAPAPAPAPQPAAQPAAPTHELSDTGVLRFLEQGSGSPQAEPPQAYDNIEMIRKLDPHSLQALRKDIRHNMPVSFAVQLNWSSTPIDVSAIAPLAIFRAYTLYTVGCMFEGRKWYGLRLGFFTDALSAKQVAQYVRSDFKSVAVVPISSREREQADATGGIDVHQSTPVLQTTARSTDEEITLLPEGARPPRVAATAPAATAAGVKPAPAQAARVVERGKGRLGNQRSLEETLEILGASQLSIDNGKGERVSISRRRAKAAAKPSSFTKLLDRLADKLRT